MLSLDMFVLRKCFEKLCRFMNESVVIFKQNGLAFALLMLIIVHNKVTKLDNFVIWQGCDEQVARSILIESDLKN